MADIQLNKEFLAERDLKIYQMRSTGISHSDIAKRFDMSVSAVSNALSRQTAKLNREASLVYPEVLRLELERLDKLHASVWPLTQHRRITVDGADDITLEPDLKAIDTVIKIQQQRARLLGLDTQKIDINVDVQGDVRHTMAGAESTYQEIDKRSETLDMLALMADSRILDADTIESMRKALGEGEIVDAEIVEDYDEASSS